MVLFSKVILKSGSTKKNKDKEFKLDPFRLCKKIYNKANVSFVRVNNTMNKWKEKPLFILQ